jgi:dienelactone hydrolase
MRYGDLGTGFGTTLSRDARHLARGDLAGPGAAQVTAEGLDLDRLSVVLYRPVGMHGRAPAVVFLPGLMAPEFQYESYARDLASHGFVVGVRGGYGPFYPEHSLKADASYIADWLVRKGLADPKRIGVAGHSRGAKDAMGAAAIDPRFRAVVALDPDDHGTPSILHGILQKLRAPLLIVGAEDSWKGWKLCARRESNYAKFFPAAPQEIELTLHHADHVQLMDNPDFPGQQICRVGTANSFTVRTIARRALVGFFVEHLQNGPPLHLALGQNGWIRVKCAKAPAGASSAPPKPAPVGPKRTN